MPILTPVTPFVDGPMINAARLNQLNTQITELQTGNPRGVLGSWDSTANADSSSATFVDVPNLVQTVTVDSPRTLSAVLIGYTNASVAGLSVQVQVTINGLSSMVIQQPMAVAAGPGRIGLTASGKSLAVPAGVIPVRAQVRLISGTGIVTLMAAATLQIIDQGAS